MDDYLVISRFKLACSIDVMINISGSEPGKLRLNPSIFRHIGLLPYTLRKGRKQSLLQRNMCTMALGSRQCLENENVPFFLKEPNNVNRLYLTTVFRTPSSITRLVFFFSKKRKALLNIQIKNNNLNIFYKTKKYTLTISKMNIL